MKSNKFVIVFFALIILGSGLPYAQGNTTSADAKGKLLQQVKKVLQQLKDIRAKGVAIREALLVGDTAKAEQMLNAFKTAYQKLPESVKNKIEQKHPGTRERFASLTLDDIELQQQRRVQHTDNTTTRNTTITNADGSKTATHNGTATQTAPRQWTNTGTTTGPNGQTWTNQGTTQRQGNTVTHEGQLVNAQGEVVGTREGVTTKQGNTITNQHTLTNTKTGQTVAVAGTATKTNNVINYEKTITGKEGQMATVTGTLTKEGNTVTRDSTTTGPQGKVYTTHATTTKEGSTITHNAATTNQQGEIVRTREGTSTKEGNTRTTDVTTTWKNGAERERQTTAVKEGNSVSRDTTVTHTPGTPSYHSDYDLFGNMFKARPTTTARTITTRTRTRKK